LITSQKMARSFFSFSILFLLSLLFFTEIKAQRILGAMSVGMNLTQVDGDDFFGFNKIGLNLGPMIAVPFGKKKNWSVSMELLYSQKGSYHRGSTDTTRYRLVQDYAEVPVLIHFTDKKVISGGLGFSYGQLINYRETTNNFYSTVFPDQPEPSNSDISFIADIQIRLFSKMWANLRYQYSVVSNRTVKVYNPKAYPPLPPAPQEQYNNVISIRLTWVFNQEKISKRPKQQNNTETF